MKLKIEESDWNTISINQTGLPEMNKEILDFLNKMLNFPDVQIIITISGKDEFLLKLNDSKNLLEKISLDINL